MSDNTNEIILEVKDLKKSFGDHVVLESIIQQSAKERLLQLSDHLAAVNQHFCVHLTSLKLLQKVMYYSMSRILQIRV